jgi:GDP-L-fucose synthase
MYAETNPEIIFHLAATVGGIGANQASPGLFFYENMIMGMNVIEQARHYGKLEKIVFVGTTCSYPKFTPVPFDESSLWDGFPEETNAPYGVAKKALMTMSSSYWDQYDLHTVSLLPANLYGPRDNFDLETSHVIPALIRKFVEGKANGDENVILWGTGSASREFLYADDAAEGLILAAEKLDDPDPVNLGTGQEITIAELATLISELVGFKGNTHRSDRDLPQQSSGICRNRRHMAR